MEVKINQKELIKRVKELVNMIELNETANNLTVKLRAVEGELEAKEQFEYERKNWNKIQLQKICSLVHVADHWNKSRFSYEMMQHKYTTYSPFRKITLLLRVDNDIVLRLDESISEYQDNDIEAPKIQENMYGKMLAMILDIGLGQLMPSLKVEVRTTDKDVYDYKIHNMREVGMQVQRPLRSVYEAYDFPDYNTGKVIDLRKK